MLSGKGLVNKIKKYHKNLDEELVLKAYKFAAKAHSTQIRSSGEPYFSHPVSVATILTEFKLDSISIITALLHDTVEDTEVTLKDIRDNFGDKVADLVDGVTKLTKIEALSANKKAAENFRKLVMATSKDIRVLLVKLADRLHNMRTIEFISSDAKRMRIANESLAIYAPLAARIGMYQIRDELQELSFAQINHEAEQYIRNKLNKNTVKKIIKELKEKISKDVKDFEIYGREKKPYSIWMKMKNKNVGFHHLYDIMAFRIIVKDIPTCYQTLGIINSNYSMIPNTFEDYISTPKENGYQSIHSTVLGPDNRKIEVQIRTKDMHEVAELGVAAHWRYKQKEKDSENEQYRWIRELISLFEHSSEPSEVLQNHKIQMHDDQVFCFTPTGDIFNLPIGSTIIDFAYAIHSEIGNKCVGAKVNGAISPLRKKLDNGDQIEIITDKNAKPSPIWLQFAFTSKAKAAIRHFIRHEKYNEYKMLGKAIINKLFAAEKLEINDDLLKETLNSFNKKNISDLYVSVAEGVVAREAVLKA
ncbi:MAG: RelA/SpoT family protein, partial [Proteobacteria bacterium]|nr:RelA/SpoT family protein [Pseudomonadota bacterium]